jgi:hypothetical protein
MVLVYSKKSGYWDIDVNANDVQWMDLTGTAPIPPKRSIIKSLSFDFSKELPHPEIEQAKPTTRLYKIVIPARTRKWNV